MLIAGLLGIPGWFSGISGIYVVFLGSRATTPRFLPTDEGFQRIRTFSPIKPAGTFHPKTRSWNWTKKLRITKAQGQTMISGFKPAFLCPHSFVKGFG
jgi:hypothetical protein